jgi:CRISPR-associated endonuclease/helicase Cas3
MAGLAAPDTAIGRLRQGILAHVRSKAGLPPGLFTLTVPTGGGKTLASLGFALDHARRYGHARIIYAIPFTSIVDQTASIFRGVLGDVVLEHHSAIEDDRRDSGDARAADSRDEAIKLRRAMEDWSPPVVVTTNVQFFESLFASRTSRARKLHNIAGSVIILDEAQALPLNLLGPAVWTLETLARDYGCTIVLCTATQPALDRRRLGASKAAPLIGLDLGDERELAPDPPALARQLRRTKLARGGEMNDDSLVEALAAAPQALVIVNSRKHALALYRAATASRLDGAIHLSTRQYAVERRRILDDVRRRLKAGEPSRLIATSLVEAGVDLDFPRVWRAEAGLEQIVQAAGRCNREGGRPLEDSIVTIFTAPDNPPPAEIKGFISDRQRMESNFDDLFAPDAITRYFEEVYWRKGPEQLDRGVADRQSILGKFALIANGTVFAYRSAAENFRMIDSGMVPVIVPADETARRAVELLAVENVPSGKLARELQRYTVSVPPKARQLLIDSGHVSFEAPDIRGQEFAVLQYMKLYDRDVGLLWEDPTYMAAEDLMV